MPQNQSSLRGTDIRAEVPEPNEGQELKIMTTVQRRLVSEQAWHVMTGVFMHEFCGHLLLEQRHISWWRLHCMNQIAYIMIITSHIGGQEKKKGNEMMSFFP